MNKILNNVFDFLKIILGLFARLLLHIIALGIILTEFDNLKIILIPLYFIIFRKIAKFLEKGKNKRCPSCKKWFAEKIVKKEILDSIGGYSTVNRTDYRKDRYGSVIGSTTRQEQVHMTTNFYRYHCKCKYCGYLYYYDTTSTFEG